MPDAITPSRRDLWIHWLVYPGHSLPTAAAPVLVAMGLAIHDHVFALMPALLAFVASWLIHIGGLFADNYQLVTRHPTVNEHPELTEALGNGTLTLHGMRLAIVACFALSALCFVIEAISSRDDDVCSIAAACSDAPWASS